MHALVAARLGDTELALRYFHETAATDLSDNGAPVLAVCVSPRSKNSGWRHCPVLPDCRCDADAMAWIPGCPHPGAVSAFACTGAGAW